MAAAHDHDTSRSSMVKIVHDFGRGVKAKVQENWLDKYIPYGKLMDLLEPPRRRLRWGVIRKAAREAAEAAKKDVVSLTRARDMSGSLGGSSPGLSMADLGRVDSLDRISYTDLTALDKMELQRDPSELQEIHLERTFLEAFKLAVDLCNAHFIVERERHIADIHAVLKLMEHAQMKLKRLSTQRSRSVKVWREMRAVVREAHEDVRDLRRFSRTNFDLSLRLVQHYRKTVSNTSHVASGIWHYVRKLDFSVDRPLAEQSFHLEQAYADAFCFSFLGLAHKELYTDKKQGWHVFGVGYRFGVCAILLLWVVWNTVFEGSHGVDLFKRPIINLYLTAGGILLLGWCWALNLVVWERFGVEYASVFGYKAEHMTSIENVYSEVSMATILYLANLLVYYKVLRGLAGPLQSLPSYVFPLAVVVQLVYKCFFPWASRKQVWRLIFQTAIAPFGAIGFREVFFADVLTSFNKISYFAVIGGCYLTEDFMRDHQDGSTPPSSVDSPHCGKESAAQKYFAPLVIALPLWFRLLQCCKRYYVTSQRFPALPNAIKYGLSVSVVLFGIFHPQYAHSLLDGSELTTYEICWVTSYTLATLYTWLWDVLMDWGLGDWKHRGLRKHLLFWRYKYVYYVAILADLALRFLWTVSLLPEAQSGPLASFQYRVRFLLPLCELSRRSMWAWFRLENEQVTRDTQLVGPRGGGYMKKRDQKRREDRSRRMELLRTEVDRIAKAAGGEEGADGAGQTEHEGTHEELEAQKKVQRDLMSHRGVLLEVAVLLAIFIGIAIWAINL